MQTNVTKRPYNHCRYAGNNGDVWKHILLLEVLRHLAPARKNSFHYFETHGGPGHARLGENGDWKRGIGRFMDQCLSKASYQHPYFDLVIPCMKENCLYKGSWVLATEFLRNLGHPNFKISVHELNADTLKMAGSAIRKGQLSNWVQLHPKSGYDALQKLEDCDFIFIDPPYRSSDGTADDWQSVMNALQKAKSISPHWMIWYPIFRREEPDQLIEMSGGTAFEFLWAPEAPGWVMKGCGMLSDPASADFLKYQPGFLRNIAEALGGQCFVLSGASKTQSSQDVGSAHHRHHYSSTHSDFFRHPVEVLQDRVVPH